MQVFSRTLWRTGLAGLIVVAASGAGWAEQQGSSWSGVSPAPAVLPGGMPLQPPAPAPVPGTGRSGGTTAPAGSSAVSAVSSGSGSADSVVTGRDIRVQLTSPNATTIGAPMSGRLTSFPLKDGDRFKEGQTLAHFYCGVQEAALGRARATLEKKKKILDTQDQLRQMGSNSRLDYQIAQAEVTEQQAEVTAAGVVLSNCTVNAPYSGRVSGAMAHEHQFVTEGTPLLEVQSDRELEMELIVPSRWLNWLKPGLGFDVVVDETGKTYKATIVRLAGKVDAVSQSIKAYGRIAKGGDDLLVGMSGKALLSPPDGGR